MNWAEQPERGSVWLTRAAVFLAQHGGWTLGRVLTLPATAWFLLTSARARSASRDYLSCALGRPARAADVIRHFDRFACSILDRVMLLCGRASEYDIQVDGLDPLLDAIRQGRGAVLLGAHLGSFEILRRLAHAAPVPVRALMYRRNGGALTSLFDRLDPALRAQVLEVGDTASMIAVRECVARGEIVGILADRAPPGHRLVPAPFFGRTARFPSGPFVLAGLLDAPVFLFHGVRTGKRRYRIGIEPFAERVVLRRQTRSADLYDWVGRYAAALERTCRAHPLEWFNFYPFWEHEDARPDPAPPRLAARPVLASPRATLTRTG